MNLYDKKQQEIAYFQQFSQTFLEHCEDLHRAILIIDPETLAIDDIRDRLANSHHLDAKN